MKLTTIYLEENKIELHASILFKETIIVNRVTVSSKFSIIGTKHFFSIQEDEQEITCKLITGIGVAGAVFSLYKNDLPVIESQKFGCLGIVVFIFGLLAIINEIIKLFTK